MADYKGDVVYLEDATWVVKQADSFVKALLITFNLQ